MKYSAQRTLHRATQHGRLLMWMAIMLLATSALAMARPNVLFIAIDDLRPELGCYGQSHMVTPHLDRLAQQGRFFERHYVQVPTCGASRCALLTGRRPSEPHHLGNEAVRISMAKHTGSGPESMAHLFRQSGYRTVSIGKVSHYPDGRIFAYNGTGDGRLEMPRSWDEALLPYGKWKMGWPSFFGYADGSGRQRGTSPPFESADVADQGYPDGLIADEAIVRLRQMKDKPFFLAVGLFKPHLPFCAPKRYFDLYDPDTLPLSPNPTRATGTDPRAYHSSGELFGSYGGQPADARTNEQHARRLRQAYFACVSYSDAQVGRILASLDELGLADNTIVVVWGDHGWQLGDHGM